MAKPPALQRKSPGTRQKTKASENGGQTKKHRGFSMGFLWDLYGFVWIYVDFYSSWQLSCCKLNLNHYGSKRYQTAGVYKTHRKSLGSSSSSMMCRPRNGLIRPVAGIQYPPTKRACPRMKHKLRMVSHWLCHIIWYLVWTLSGFKCFLEKSSNGGTAFDLSITNCSKPECRWFKTVTRSWLMVPRESPISSVSKCMDMFVFFKFLMPDDVNIELG